MTRTIPLIDQAEHLAMTGQTDKAIALCLSVGPASSVELTNLGARLSAGGYHAEAVTVLLQTLNGPPYLVEAIASLSASLNETKRFGEAVTWCKRAINQGPVPAQIHNNLGNALNGLGLQHDALTYFQSAAKSMPDNPKIWMNLANTALEIGGTDLAERGFVRAIDLSPHDGSYHRSLAMVHRYSPNDPHLTMMEELLPDARNWPAEDRMQLDFALGKAYDELSNYERAMFHLVRANAAKRAITPYDEARALGVMDAMEQTITPDFLAEHAGHGDLTKRPIFIIGMPRSGTTLVEQVLSSLPDVLGMGELMAFQTSLSQAGQFPATGPTRSWFKGLGSAYIKALGIIPPHFLRTLDKMPSNFIYAGLIHMALPNAKIIHLHRNPIDTCLSCFSRLFTGDQPFSYDLSELGRYYRRYEQLMAHWRKILPVRAFIDVEYELLVSDFEAQARRIVEFCGLEWNNICFDFHKSKRSVKTASAAQVRQPLYKSSVGRYEHYAPYLEPLVTALGQR